MPEIDYITNKNYGQKKPRKKRTVVFVSSLLISGVLIAVFGISKNIHLSPVHLTKSQVSKILGKRKLSSKLENKETITSTSENEEQKLSVQYSLNLELQSAMEEIIQDSRNAIGAFIALDPTTGQVLAMVSKGLNDENITLRSTFPAASVFKVVTAAAAIESGRLSASSLIPLRGGMHTLFKQNVLKSGGIDPESNIRNRFRLIPFSDAFAKSVNSIFGKVGVFGVGPDGLKKTANGFLFGQTIPFEMTTDQSQAPIPTEEFSLAETASGFTKSNTLSPLHGALIAAAVANHGLIMEPSIVDRIQKDNGKMVYEFQPKTLSMPIQKNTASQLAEMMHRTITSGTSKKAFRRFEITLDNVFVGGKTGTLTGTDPQGKYDWFVGYGSQSETKLAIATMFVHGEHHGAKASQVARKAFEVYFKSIISNRTPSKSNI